MFTRNTFFRVGAAATICYRGFKGPVASCAPDDKKKGRHKKSMTFCCCFLYLPFQQTFGQLPKCSIILHWNLIQLQVKYKCCVKVSIIVKFKSISYQSKHWHNFNRSNWPWVWCCLCQFILCTVSQGSRVLPHFVVENIFLRPYRLAGITSLPNKGKGRLRSFLCA